MRGDETVDVQASDLDEAPTGEEFRTADYLLLAVLGVVIPVALLIWGWL